MQDHHSTLLRREWWQAVARTWPRFDNSRPMDFEERWLVLAPRRKRAEEVESYAATRQPSPGPLSAVAPCLTSDGTVAAAETGFTGRSQNGHDNGDTIRRAFHLHVHVPAPGRRAVGVPARRADAPAEGACRAGRRSPARPLASSAPGRDGSPLSPATDSSTPPAESVLTSAPSTLHFRPFLRWLPPARAATMLAGRKQEDVPSAQAATRLAGQTRKSSLDGVLLVRTHLRRQDHRQVIGRSGSGETGPNSIGPRTPIFVAGI
jgi:hypothetical protein